MKITRPIKLFLILCTLGMSAVWVLSSNSTQYTGLSLDFLDQQQFELYMLENGKSYSDSEFFKRFRNFRENLAYINLFNSQDYTWKLGLNSFADMTLEEFVGKYLPKKFPLRSHGEYEAVGLDYPPSVDWRTKGAVTPVKDQLACGGCYAFSAVSSIESAWYLSGRPLTSFSEQSIIDCSSSFGNDQCYGGLVDHAFDYARAKGIPLESTYPYNSANEKCNHTLADKVAVKITGYVDVVPNNSTALLKAVSQQPVSVGVEADQLSWTFYKSGVITRDCGTSIDHAVVVDGYDTASDPPYYIVRNSWGPKWGQAGYVYIEIKDGPGTCGIQQLPSYPYF
jgi:C1A family cysteine protease